MHSSLVDPDTLEAIRRIPKAELHVHLEGSVRPATLLQLSRKHGMDLGCSTQEDVLELYRFRDFKHFMDLYGALTFALREPEDFALVTYELGETAFLQGVRYVEATFTAGTHFRFKGIPFDELMDAVSEGALRAFRDYGVVVKFILDHVRGFSVEACYQTAEWCVSGASHGVVGLGLAGFEPGWLASTYGGAIKWALERDIPFVPHAGEVVGPEGMWDALTFRPRRIGHGVRAIEDDALIDELRSRGTVLEICPTSNVVLGNVSGYDVHPLRQLWDKGVKVTLNSDDPPMFNTSLLDEFCLAYASFGFSLKELAELSKVAIHSALISGEPKDRLVREFEDGLASVGY